MARKLFKDWERSGYPALHRFLQIGDTVDKAILTYVANTDPEEIPETQNVLQDTSFSDADIGNVRLFHTFERRGRYHAWKYKGLCPKWVDGEPINRHPGAARKIFICSRFHADTKDQCETNRIVARIACSLVRKEGNIAVAPHLYFPQFTEDKGDDRSWGIEAGHLLMAQCDEILVVIHDGQVSAGMLEDINYAIYELAMDPKIMTICCRNNNLESLGLEHIRGESDAGEA